MYLYERKVDMYSYICSNYVRNFRNWDLYFNRAKSYVVWEFRIKIVTMSDPLLATGTLNGKRS